MAHVVGSTGVAGFADLLARHGSGPALRSMSTTITYAELHRQVSTARAALGEARALVRLRPAPTVEFVVAWLAALTGGHATLLTHDDGLAAAYGVSMEYDDDGWRPTGATCPALHPDLRLLLSTSGSTGSPKLVRLSGDNLDANASSIATYLGLRSDDVALTTLPLDYCYGLSVLHSHLAAGACVHLDDRSVTDPGLWADARAAGVTSFAGVPYTFELLASTGWPDLPTLRQVTQAGGRMAPERVHALATQGAREGWELVVMYGQTEATARMAYLPPDLVASRPSAVGVAIPGGRFRLEPTDGVDPGVGELVYSGPNVMLGYAESPADLALGRVVDELHTGDLARITDGLVEIVGRRSRFAKLFGERIDLDRVQTLAGLRGYAVACAEASDGGQLVVAIPGSPDSWLVAEIGTAVAEDTGLPSHAIRTVGVEDLPRLPNGKPDHRAVALLAADRGPSGEIPEASIAQLYGRILGRDDVTPQDSFMSLGGDSLSYVELSLRLEQRIGTLPPDWQQWTVARLADRLAASPSVRSGRFPGWARIDTTIALRAAAIVMIVGTHTNLWVLLGGAHILLAVAGANFARFHLADEGPRDRVRRVFRAATRIAVPSVVWIATVTAVTGDYPWRTVLLLNDLLGSRTWSEPAWHYWFLDVVVLLATAAGLVTAIPWVMALERRHRFAVPATLTGVALIPRLWASASSYDDDLIHSSPFIAWLFLGGWAAAVASTSRQRLAVTGLMAAGILGFTGDQQRDLVIAAGVLALIWLRTVPWPRRLSSVAGTLASASLFIYLTHWQIYPHFEDRWPIVGLALSLAVGVLAWHAINLVPTWTRLLERPRSHPPHPTGGRARTPALRRLRLERQETA